ncbi:phenol hydroxylase [Pontibacterium sp. N1Y112]|uniref:Phenol hydroxylase n=1 Tax=Pontibacterium sinense TaxID=2781979 RepID=A0A8J7FFX8_9GAMM|nr:phenol hydroxylase subunit [Pontibacterium sinense]MBE9396593.1 phenol hydroxylase [Pontibacterium sinense]
MAEVINLDTRSSDPSKPTFERLTKYVRVRSPQGARFVEFDFAIGDPSLFVELIMPQGAYEHFCDVNDVIHMTDEQMAAVDAEMEKWRYGEDTLMSHNHDHFASE